MDGKGGRVVARCLIAAKMEDPAHFGHDPFDPYQVSRPLTRIGGHKKTELQQQVQTTCPNHPGVYGMLDRRGNLIYVGKSKALRSRLLCYFSAANAKEKAGRIIATTRVIQWETQPNEFAALLREQHLIRSWTPLWNVQEIPKRQRPVYLCLGRQPAPYFFLANAPPVDTIACEGPFYGAQRLGHAVDALNNYFLLRDCSNRQPMNFSDQLSLFDLDQRPGCLRMEVKTCLGPCAGGCSRGRYDQQVAAAKGFLEGKDDQPLERLRAIMEQSAGDRQYERAAKARDDLKVLTYLHRKLTYLAEIRRTYSFVYPTTGFDGRGVWYLIRQGEIFDRVIAPRCSKTYAAVRPSLRRWRDVIETGTAVENGDHLFPHTLSLIARWFRKHRQELDQTFLPSQAGRKYRRHVSPLPGKSGGREPVWT